MPITPWRIGLQVRRRRRRDSGGGGGDDGVVVTVIVVLVVVVVVKAVSHSPDKPQHLLSPPPSSSSPITASWGRVSGIAVTISTIILMAFALNGYLFFHSSTEGLIMDNFTSTAAQALKIFIIIHLLCYSEWWW